MKKFLSVVLALAMVLSLCVTAFAADGDKEIKDFSDAAEVTVSGITKGATLKVLVPTKSQFILNPYQVSVTETINGASVTSTDQIISAFQKVENQSTLPIIVNISVTGEVDGDGVKLVDSVAYDSTTKDIELTLKFEALAATATDVTNSANALTLKNKEAVKTTSADEVSLTATGGAKSVLGFKFTGEANKASEQAWADSDKVNATIAFTFAVDTDSIT